MPDKSEDPWLSRSELRKSQYERCTADLNASESIMGQIPTLLLAVNTLILTIVFQYVRGWLISGILLLLAVIWSLLLVVAFDRYRWIGFHRSVFMERIEREAIDGLGLPPETNEAEKQDTVLRVKTEDTLGWLDREVTRREPEIDEECKFLVSTGLSEKAAREKAERDQRLKIPGSRRKWILKNAREPLALALLLSIVIADVGLLVGILLTHFTPIHILNYTQFGMIV